ncbi:unnamed protein product [Gongylonema pulchrum]|uniref:CTNNB1_binding domain-containing protein n=1 Tax=Gongylonema pulchrum TaxID=637853 RepID=A0A183ESH0_9BILA|nr:unnamed protein product [Gongylonema pulchrum]
MDGVDISSSSEMSGEELGTDRSPTSLESNAAADRGSNKSVDNFAMESDVDAELDYDEEDGDEGESEQKQAQNQVSLLLAS